MRCRRLDAHLGEPAGEAGARRQLVALRKLDAADRGLAPGDPAATDRGIEQRQARHLDRLPATGVAGESSTGAVTTRAARPGIGTSLVTDARDEEDHPAPRAREANHPRP